MSHDDTPTPTGVLVFAERHDVGLELLHIGRRLADDLALALVQLLLGEEPTRDSGTAGADRLLVAGIPSGRSAQDPDLLLDILTRAVDATAPRIVLLGGTGLGTEVAARLAQRLGTGCATDCLDLWVEQEGLLVERRCLGRFLARQQILGRPAIATVPPHRFQPPPSRSTTGTLQTTFIELAPAPPRRRIFDVQERPPVERPIEQSEAVVAVGRGVRAMEDLSLAREVARLLGAALAATRPLTDHLGWLPVDVKIGLSGRTVAPELYLACGISGQIEHIVGMRGARIVVAINNDPAAPIFDQADYAIVGDLYAILPALAEALAAGRGERETLPAVT